MQTKQSTLHEMGRKLIIVLGVIGSLASISGEVRQWKMDDTDCVTGVDTELM